MIPTEQRIKAKQFAENWKGRGSEKRDTHLFWTTLLREVYGVEKLDTFIEFEAQIQLSHISFADAVIPSTHVLIEQKSIDKDLSKPTKQSDGTYLTPYEQAKRYADQLVYATEQKIKWIVICNFKEFYIYNMKKFTNKPEIILLENLDKEFQRLEFLVNPDFENIQKKMELSLEAGRIVGNLYDAILKQYQNPNDPQVLKSLNILCVRLVFCLYADDAGVFSKDSKFHDYLKRHKANARRALIDLFQILEQKKEERDPYIDDDLAKFPYVDGGLFAGENIVIPKINEEIVDLILRQASEDFNWSEISPTIFGAVFESTLNPETRRSGGMHYTSIENIHKVIDPLFLDDLKEEFEEIKKIAVSPTQHKKLRAFQEKLSQLNFLDPACGSGNFLTETYLSLRRLENKVIALLNQDQISFNVCNPIKVSIDQFYGIEINDFAVKVTKVALWIAESQMLKETEDVIHTALEYLPLKASANIIEGNALQLDWESVLSKHKLSYIMGNPPFVGARLMDKTQKEDIKYIFKGWKNTGNLDYVCGWYKKASDLMIDSAIKTALVSTNSISQGETVANLWKPLFENGIHIDFAYRTFRWDSETKLNARVHCVIIGFSTKSSQKNKIIYTEETSIIAQNINGYLLDADNIFIESSNKPLCNVPKIGIGNKPIDNGNYLFTMEEKEAFIQKEPKSEKYFKPWYGSKEFINNCPRYCLWLGECPPNELRKMPECLKRVQAVKEYRLSSKSAGTIKLANTPTHFHVENIPDSQYLLIPRVSSEKRKYVPMGYMSKEDLASDSVHIIPDATLYHFGILTSNVHMAWMRVVGGRLKSDYRYSKDIVYNNFPWPTPTEKQKAKIEKTAQAILDIRASIINNSLADLYDELTMPLELRKAHEQNDRAVMAAYGFKDTTESTIVAELMKLYQKMT